MPDSTDHTRASDGTQADDTRSAGGGARADDKAEQPKTGPEFQTIGDGAGSSGGNAGWPRVAGYEIFDVLGSGGMGVVYKARQSGLNRVVALKMILAGSHARTADVARFRAEAEAVARLQHPGIVQVYEIGEWKSESGGAPMPYFSLEYIDGGPLSAYLAGTPQPPRWAAEFMTPLCDAMQYAHDHHVVHRDLKPANILLTALDETRPVESLAGQSQSLGFGVRALQKPMRTAKITDFGLAKQLDHVSGHTVSGAILGTPSYMAPEQAAGNAAEAGPAVDVYALGAILYELLTGRPPFKGAHALETIEQVRRQDPVPPSRLQPKTPRDLETICLKCLRKEPEKRYASARDLGDDLRRYLLGQPILARHIGQAERLRLWCQRNPVVAALIAGIAAVFILGTLVSSFLAVKFYGERELAKENAARATESKRDSDRRRYVAEFRGAVHKLERNQVDEVRLILDGLLPEENVEDLRGFEWHYLKRQCELDLQTIFGHSETIFAVAYNPDGLTMASASKDKTLRVYDRATGETLRVLSGHADQVLALAFTADGSSLASGSSDGTIKVWDPSSGTLRMTLKGHTDWVRDVAFSRDGKRLYSAGVDRTMRAWDLATQAGIVLTTHTASFRCIAICPGEGVILGGGTDGAVIIHDGARVVQTLVAHNGAARAMDVSRDGTLLATCGADRTIKIWQTKGWQLRNTLTGHADEVADVAFSPDGTRIASSSSDRTVRVWNIQQSRELLTLRGHPYPVFTLAYSPDGRNLASAGADRTIKIWDANQSLERMGLVGHTRPVTGVAFCPGRDLLASCSYDGTVIVWSSTIGTKQAELRVGPAELYGLAFHPSQNLLAVAGGEGKVHFYETITWTLVERVDGHDGRMNCIAFSPDGTWIATCGRDGTVALWDATTRRIVRRIQAHSESTSAIAFSGDSRELASVGLDKAVRVWEVATGREIMSTPEVTGTYSGIAFHPRLRRVVSGSLSMWNIDTRNKDLDMPVAVIPYGMTFSSDGRRLASTGPDLVVRFRDSATGSELLALTASPVRPGRCVAMSGDGLKLACGAEDNVVYLWDGTSLDPERRSQREALSFVRALSSKPMSPLELRTLIQNDRTVSPNVRNHALSIVIP